MLTRRENLLIRPWQERRYIHHREKVNSALPAIDNTPPPQRPHVSCKLKKIQKEAERCSQIVNDNFTLLQHLSNIMRTTRVDHFWEEPPPNFLQKVGIYKIRSRPQKKTQFELPDEERPATRKERCYGCSPERFHKVEIIPEERIPFAPPKKRVTRKVETPPDWATQYKFRCAEDRPEFRGKTWKKLDRRGSTRQMDGEKRRYRRKRKQELKEQSQCIYLSKGGLTLAVKFPSRSEVLMSNQSGTRILQRELCECKSFPRKLSLLGKSATETLILNNPDKPVSDSSQKDMVDNSIVTIANELSDLKLTKVEEEEKDERSVTTDGSHLVTKKEQENENSESETEEEQKSMENIDLEHKEFQKEDVEEEIFEEKKKELDLEVVEMSSEEKIVEEEEVEEEIPEEQHSDEELEDTYRMDDSYSKSPLAIINEDEVIRKLAASEGKDSEEENTIENYIAVEEEANSSNVQLNKSDDQLGKAILFKEDEFTQKESNETEELDDELIDFYENDQRGLLVTFPKNNQSIKEEEDSISDTFVKTDKNSSTEDFYEGITGTKEETAENNEQYDKVKKSMTLEDECTDEPIAMDEIGMKETFSETDNEVLLRGITFDTSQDQMTDELIEHNEDEGTDEVEKSDENFSKESIDQKIEQVLEDVENFVLELNKDDFLEDFKSDNLEANDDTSKDDKEVNGKSDKI